MQPKKTRRRKPNPLVAVLLVVAFAMPTAFARVAVAWFCEGRVCGTAPSSCCCSSPGAQDAQCDTPSGADRPASSPGETQALCDAGCDCRMVVNVSDETPPAVKSATPSGSPFERAALSLLPAPPPAPPAPALRLAAVGHVEARGPPTASTAFRAFPSLRAPPHS